MAPDAPRPRALLAAHVVALLRSKLRAAPDGSSTTVRVRAAGAEWDIVNVQLVGPTILLDVRERRDE